MEIIDNSRELKGFENIDEDIKLVGYFKSHKSERKNLDCDGATVPQHLPITCMSAMCNKYQEENVTFFRLKAQRRNRFVFLPFQTLRRLLMLLKSSTLTSSSTQPSTPK